MTGDPLADPLTAIGQNLESLRVNLARRAFRDPATADAKVARAGHEAVAAIDLMLRDLHRLRAQLVTEIREDQDAAMARSGELLRRLKEERGGC